MPASPRQLFDPVGIEMAGSVAWGGRVSTGAAGVYVVSLHGDPELAAGVREAPVCRERVGAWIEVASGMTLDGERADVEGGVRFFPVVWALSFRTDLASAGLMRAGIG